MFHFLLKILNLHIGPRPKNSIYSGGQTSWQDPEEKEKNLNRLFPKLWYGWFGRGTKNRGNLINSLQKIIKKVLKILRKQFRR
jgi:hypothetical protein